MKQLFIRTSVVVLCVLQMATAAAWAKDTSKSNAVTAPAVAASDAQKVPTTVDLFKQILDQQAKDSVTAAMYRPVLTAATRGQ